ncbi:MAG: hypothetical protein FWG11_07710, partial [Promicromonosporaceae bacterium]|nr:hypothetical protein [Promicromonosporaceae bacterium]
NVVDLAVTSGATVFSQAIALLEDGTVLSWGLHSASRWVAGNPTAADAPTHAEPMVTEPASFHPMIAAARREILDIGVAAVGTVAGGAALVLQDGTVRTWGSSAVSRGGYTFAGGNWNAIGLRNHMVSTVVDPARLPQLGGGLSDGINISPYSVVDQGDGWVRKGFNLPGTIAPGEQRVIRVGGFILQNQDVNYVPGEQEAVDGRQVVVNQAWVTSPNTPFERVPDFTHPDCVTTTNEQGEPILVGCPPHGQVSPPNPIPPLPDYTDPDGVPGNWICDTDAPEEHFWTGPQFPGNTLGWQRWREDLCDQVPVVIPPLPPAPLGNLAGYVWVDLSRDHLRGEYDGVAEPRLEGVLVYLYRRNAEGELVRVNRPREMTDANGWFEFTGLLPGDFEVLFVLPNPQDGDGNDDAERGFSFVERHVGGGGPCHSEGDGVRIGVGNACIDSDAIESGEYRGFSGSVTVVANQRAYADAGVVINRPAISVIKTSPNPIGDDRVFNLPEGAGLDHWLACTDEADPGTCVRLDSIPVQFTIQNIGNETLNDFEVTDTTLLGPDVVWDTCDAVAPAPADWIVPTDLELGDLALRALAAELVPFEEPSPADPEPVRIFEGVFDELELATGESITCHGRLLLLGDDGESPHAVDDVHHDRIDVRSRGAHTLINAGDNDDWRIEVTTLPEIVLPPTGGLGHGNPAPWVILAGLAAAAVLAVHRGLLGKKTQEVVGAAE